MSLFRQRERGRGQKADSPSFDGDGDGDGDGDQMCGTVKTEAALGSHWMLNQLGGSCFKSTQNT